jgi:hypothetical protein
MKFKKKSSPRKLLSQYQPNFAEMILGWPPSKIVSGDPDFQPRCKKAHHYDYTVQIWAHSGLK